MFCYIKLFLKINLLFFLIENLFLFKEKIFLLIYIFIYYLKLTLLVIFFFFDNQKIYLSNADIQCVYLETNKMMKEIITLKLLDK